MQIKKNYKSDYAKVKNQGSSKSGVHNWWYQRFTGIVLIGLFFWLVYFIYSNKHSSTEDLVFDLIKLNNLIPMILLTIFGFYHAYLGMQVIVEDYIHDLKLRFSLLISLKLFCIITVVSLITSLFYFVLTSLTVIS